MLSGAFRNLIAICKTTQRCPLVVVTSMILVQGSIAFGQEDAKILHNLPGDAFANNRGHAVSGVGDVNGDGFSDFIAGVPAATSPSGVVISGSAILFSGQDGSVIRTFWGDNVEDRLGYSVAGAGDVNRDGVPDTVVGVPWADNLGHNAGSVRVFSGANGSLLYEFHGDIAEGYFGNSVAGAGDVNGDRFDDIIVGAPYSVVANVQQVGTVRVFSGKTGKVLYSRSGSASNDLFGFNVAGAGDVNNDGFGDFLATTKYGENNGLDSGSVTVFSGQDGGTLYTFTGASAFERFGSTAAGAGDVNGDGFHDIIVGSEESSPNGKTGAGSVQIFSGRTGLVLYYFEGANRYDYFGYSVAGAGDVNGDGLADVIVGSRWIGNGAGRVQIFSGKGGALLYTFDGIFYPSTSAGEGLGHSVASAGDVNKDGYDDVVIGAPYHGEPASSTELAGRVLVIGDGCPGDTSKGAPGLCGCGVADTDTDKDGTPDCNDQCPSDASKVAVGQCGCGTAETDTDKDGTPDCNDRCLSDGSKATPGQCGCGIADIDTDKDGTADCNDRCPNDPSTIGECNNPGISDATPTPTPLPNPNLLEAPKVKTNKSSARIWVVGKFGKKDRVTFLVTGPKNRTVQPKRFIGPKKGTFRFQATLSKLPKGTYQAYWRVLRSGTTLQQSSARTFAIKDSK